ncbi:RES family NAD+ phosphorylase [Cognatishimia sp. MH4019]|uniref:RES family NAD+ phosphorylase n=1 Tax=Cognatishimia sp. MH4019 TaxID=2854030 RepID=UPI0021032F4D|nr:RES domain-containing protein [Cognatishimia sp. MH4019]
MNPIWARDPLSGEGARRFGGRFNKKGRAALYTALSPETAIKEANQVGHLQPTTLVSYHADIALVFDGSDGDLLEAHGQTFNSLAANDWRDRMVAGVAPTQAFAEALIAEGYQGLLIQSYARGATAKDCNLVLWDWAKGLSLIDDEKRLG